MGGKVMRKYFKRKVFCILMCAIMAISCLAILAGEDRLIMGNGAEARLTVSASGHTYASVTPPSGTFHKATSSHRSGSCIEMLKVYA